LASEGRTFFLAADFGHAAHAFEHALEAQPGRADLHFWLGRTEVRRADMASPLFAAKHARAARLHLERACALEPGNREYARELFELYIDSPECFGGSLERAAALAERLGADEEAALAASRREHSGAGWAVQRSILAVYSTAGRAIPTSLPTVRRAAD